MMIGSTRVYIFTPVSMILTNKDTGPKKVKRFPFVVVSGCLRRNSLMNLTLVEFYAVDIQRREPNFCGFTEKKL